MKEVKDVPAISWQLFNAMHYFLQAHLKITGVILLGSVTMVLGSVVGMYMVISSLIMTISMPLKLMLYLLGFYFAIINTFIQFKAMIVTMTSRQLCGERFTYYDAHWQIKTRVFSLHYWAMYKAIKLLSHGFMSLLEHIPWV